VSNVVRLEWFEIDTGSQVGLSRCLENIRMEQGFGFGYNKGFTDQAKDSIMGAMGEVATAKHLHIYFGCHVNSWKEPDLIYNGKHLQVRTQQKKNNNFLIIRKNAKPEDLYILVLENTPEFTIAGAIYAKDAMQDKYLTDFGQAHRPKVWGIPQQDLFPLKEILKKELV